MHVGLLLILIVLGASMPPVHPHGSRGRQRGVCLRYAVFVYRDMSLKDVPKVLLGLRQYERDDSLYHHHAVLFSFLMANENIPQHIAAWITSSG